jgi:hypothetical protein
MLHSYQTAVVQLGLLEEKADISSISFKDFKIILHDFFNDILLPSFKDKIDSTVFEFSLKMLKAIGSDTEASIKTANNSAAVDAWVMIDSCDKPLDKNILRLLICGLVDEEKDDYYLHGSEPAMEAVFMCIHDVNADYCKKFREFVELHDAFSKYLF